MKQILYYIIALTFLECGSNENKVTPTKQVYIEKEISNKLTETDSTCFTNNLDGKFRESIKKFVPNTWTINDTVVGILNYDTIPDLIILIEKDSVIDEHFRQGDQGLIVLFGKKNSEYSLNGVYLNLLNNRTDFGAIDGKGIVSIQKNKIFYSFFPAHNLAKDFEFLYSDKHSKFFLIKTTEIQSLENKNSSNIEKYKIGEIPIENYKIE
jgi:hypothetical protein